MWLIVACVWASTAFFCVAAVLWYVWVTESKGSACVLAGLLLPLWFLFGYGPVWLAQQAASPVIATLRQDSWECVQSHQEQATVYLAAGKSVMPSTQTVDVCDVYARK